MTEEERERPSRRNRIKLTKEESARLAREALGDVQPVGETPAAPAPEGAPPADPLAASAPADPAPPPGEPAPAPVSLEEPFVAPEGIGFAVPPSGLMKAVPRPPAHEPPAPASPPSRPATSPFPEVQHLPGVGFDVAPSGVLKNERRRTTKTFLDSVSLLLGGGPVDALSSHPGAPHLTEEDPLTPERFQTRTKEILGERLGRPSRRLAPMVERVPAIVVEDLDAVYEERQVLFDLKFAVQRGEILAILGGSGSGKTTLLKHLIGLLRPSRGKIVIAGQDIATLEGDDLALVLKTIGMLFQYSALFNSLTIAQNVALPLREYTNLPEPAIDAIVRLKLALVGLPGVAARFPSELSGGMKKRAALARALALDPDVLFFDEPGSGLDPIAAAALDQLILHLNRSFGTTMVIVTHDLENAFNVAHRILMLDQGKIRKIGTPSEVKASEDPWVKAFLARSTALRDAVDEGFFSKLGIPKKADAGAGHRE